MVQSMAKYKDNYDRDREQLGDWLSSRTGEITLFLLAVGIGAWAVIF